MARSFLHDFGDLLSSVSSDAWDAASNYLMKPTSEPAPEQLVMDALLGQGAGQFVDSASESLFGRPLLSDTKMPVDPGASLGETHKAAVKLAEARAQQIEKENSLMDAREREMTQRLAALQSLSKPGTATFVADGEGVYRNDQGSGPSKGQFSKYKTIDLPKPKQDEVTKARYLALRAGPEGVKAFIQSLPGLMEARLKSVPSMEQLATAQPGSIDPNRQILAILSQAVKSNNPQQMQFVIASLRSIGLQDEQISELISNFKTKK